MTESESASRVVTIQVTEEDIEKGIQQDRFRCPAAIAINRHLKDAHAVVTSDYIAIVTPTKFPDLRRQLPPSVEDFIKVFDDYGPEHAHPFSFTLELPGWFLKTEDQDPNPEAKA